MSESARSTTCADLCAHARAILKANDLGGYTVPNRKVYPYQWNWDSAFVALGYATFDPVRAWREIETLFEAQWEDGFLPHIVFWKEDPGYFPGSAAWGTGHTPPTSGITQPPVVASVVRWLWDASAQDAAARERLEHLFPRLLALHRWFRDNRDPEGRGLVVAVHPWETGRDNSPEWDAPAAAVDVTGIEPYERRDLQHIDQHMRPLKDDYDRYVALLQYGRRQGWRQRLIASEGPFRVADVGMTMILLRAERDLQALAATLGRAGAAAEIAARIADLEHGAESLWDATSEAYCSHDMISGRPSGVLTSASFLAFYAGVGDAERRRRLLAHLERIAGKVRYLLPSFDPDRPEFDALRYWRGPIWAVVNHLVATGLAECGAGHWAGRLRGDTRALIARSGFYEAYCPRTGRGTGGDDFSWTAAMWLHWAGAADPREAAP